MTATMPGNPVEAVSRRQLQPRPEDVQLTWSTVRAWRELGYRVSEQRVAGWLLLLARSNWESAMYKVVGPIFDGSHADYQGRRVA